MGYPNSQPVRLRFHSLIGVASTSPTERQMMFSTRHTERQRMEFLVPYNRSFSYFAEHAQLSGCGLLPNTINIKCNEMHT